MYTVYMIQVYRVKCLLSYCQGLSSQILLSVCFRRGEIHSELQFSADPLLDGAQSQWFFRILKAFETFACCTACMTQGTIQDSRISWPQRRHIFPSALALNRPHRRRPARSHPMRTSDGPRKSDLPLWPLRRCWYFRRETVGGNGNNIWLNMKHQKCDRKRKRKSMAGMLAGNNKREKTEVTTQDLLKLPISSNILQYPPISSNILQYTLTYCDLLSKLSNLWWLGGPDLLGLCADTTRIFEDFDL